MNQEPKTESGPIGPYFWKSEGNTRDIWYFECPGCKCPHAFTVWHGEKQGDGWTFNGDAYAPTFSPSLLVNQSDPATRCHLFLEAGKLRFLSDCHHELAGQTVDLPEWDED